MMRFPALVLVIVSHLLLADCALQAASNQTALISTGRGLLKAFQNSSVGTIILEGNYSVSSDHKVGYSADPIARDVTVTALPDVVLDLNFQPELLHLCSSCRLTFSNITITNARRGTGDGFDGIAGDPGSIILLQNVIRLRLACIPAADTAAVMHDTPRSRRLPGQDSKQNFEIRSVTYQGQEYPQTLVLHDYTIDQPPTLQEFRGHFGGVALSQQNVTRICLNTVSESCLQEKSPEVCVNDLVDAIMAQSVSQSHGGLAPGAWAAAIAVPIVVVGALVLVAAVLLVLRRRRKHQQLLQLPLSKHPSSVPPDVYVPPHALHHADSAMEAAMQRKISIEVRIVQPEQQLPLGGRPDGWEIVAYSTSPLLSLMQEQSTVVQFGELLGSGSFGRVYRAQWAGHDCAVKVIEHNLDALPAVEEEAQLMLSFDHPNLVRAYHYVTYQQQSQESASNCSHSNTGSAGSRKKLVGNNAAADQAACSHGQPVIQQGGVELPTAGSSGRGGRPQKQLLPPPPADAVVGLGSSGGSVPQGAGSGGSRGSQVGAGDVKWDVRPGCDPPKCETWLVLEYCDLGTLGGIAAHNWNPLQEDDRQMVHRLLLLQDTAMGLAALHAEATVHGDLNARNVLVCSNEHAPAGMVAKLADLGLSRVIKQHKTHHTTQAVGTINHMPPELLRYGRLSPAVDIYSFAILMWEVFTCRLAFDRLHYGQFFETVVLQKLRPIVPQTMPLDYQLLMKQCWAANSTDRPSIGKLLACLDAMIQDRQYKLQQDNCQSSTAEAPLPKHGAVQTLCRLLDIPTPTDPQHQQPPFLGSSTEVLGSSTADGSPDWLGLVQLGISCGPSLPARSPSVQLPDSDLILTNTGFGAENPTGVQ